jgi:hypothetical protein
MMLQHHDRFVRLPLIYNDNDNSKTINATHKLGNKISKLEYNLFSGPSKSCRHQHVAS